MPPMPAARSNFGSALIGDKIYVVGGNTDVINGNKMERFDIFTQTWEVMPPMPSARRQFATAVLDGKLYVVGGVGVGAPFVNVFATMERFDPDTQTWGLMPPMPAARSSCSAAVVNGKLYVIGGKGHFTAIAKTERFDPATSAWETMPPMMTDCATAVVDGNLYVLGGSHRAD
eukprot:5100179-Prymnesium_polylepis.1